MGSGMRHSPWSADTSGHGRLPARSGYRSPAGPLPRANELSCRSHPELNVRRSQSTGRAAACHPGYSIAGYLAGAPIPRPRREALPLPLAVLAQWERWICSGSAPEHEILFIGSILLTVWAGLRFADAQPTCPSSLLPDRHVLRGECWRTKENWPAMWCPCLWFFWTTSMLGLEPFVLQCASQLALLDGGSGGQNLVIDYLVPTRDLLRKASSGGCNPNALQLSNDVSLASPTGTTDARRSNVTRASPKKHAAQPQSHHAQHHASDLLFREWAESFRPLTAQKRGAQIPLTEPPVKIYPLTLPMR